MTNLHIKKQTHYFANKSPFSQSYGFSSSHVWMGELNYKENWVLKNWCFWTVVLEKTLESPLVWRKIKPVNPKGNQSWIFIGRMNAEVLIPDAKTWLTGKAPDAGKDWRQEEKGMAEGEMVGWYHWLDKHEFGQVLGIGDGQGGLAWLHSMGSQRVRHDWVTELNCTCFLMKLKRNKAVLVGKSPIPSWFYSSKVQ